MFASKIFLHYQKDISKYGKCFKSNFLINFNLKKKILIKSSNNVNFI